MLSFEERHVQLCSDRMARTRVTILVNILITPNKIKQPIIIQTPWHRKAVTRRTAIQIMSFVGIVPLPGLYGKLLGYII